MNSRIDVIRSKKGFYRDNYSRVCWTLLVALGLIFFMGMSIVYCIIFHPTPDFYATSTDGKIVRLFPVNALK